MMTVPAWWVTRHKSSNAKVMAQQSPPGTSPQRVAAISTFPRGTYLEKSWEILHRIQPRQLYFQPVAAMFSRHARVRPDEFSWC